jgi:uncharacterized short protein YbdD (DUF466 family)
MSFVQNALASAWRWLRQASGDDAYERYLERQQREGATDVLSREEFYCQRLERRYNNKDNPSRCC